MIFNLSASLCPLECIRTEYKTSISNSQFLSEIYFDYIKNNSAFSSKYDEDELTIDFIADDIVKLNIYYESLTYTLTEESVSINLVSMFSSIGGFMGMFLGMSIMTLVELLEIIIKYFYSLINPKKNIS